MRAKELISNLVLPLLPDDTVEQALSMMSIYHIKDLPVVSNSILLGLLSEDEATTVEPQTKIRDIKLSNNYIYVKSSDHVFEVLNRLSENKITIVPVVDDNEKFIGIITQDDLIHFYASSFSFNEPGSIIVLETSKRGYSLSEVSRIIEMENASVIASFITELDNSEAVLLTLKLNKNDIHEVIIALERYDYKIHASFSEKEYNDDLKDRYDQLMNYLNV